MDGSHCGCFEAVARQHAPTRGLLRVDAAHPLRRDAEDFIAACYEQAYAARVPRFLPTLLALVDEHGRIDAAVGVRFAGDAPLFVEHYLDAPVESVLAERFAVPVERSHTVEIGHLCGLAHGTGARLFPQLARWLEDAGAQWAVFAATAALRRQFDRIGLQPLALAPALPARLGGEAAAWGSYYQTDPWVVGGPLALARALQAGRR